MNIREQDHIEISWVQDVLSQIKEQSNNTIDYCIKELNDEKEEREQARQAPEIDAGN